MGSRRAIGVSEARPGAVSRCVSATRGPERAAGKGDGTEGRVRRARERVGQMTRHGKRRLTEAFAEARKRARGGAEVDAEAGGEPMEGTEEGGDAQWEEDERLEREAEEAFGDG